MSVDVRKLEVGDMVVFANPEAGYHFDIAKVRTMGFKVGEKYVVERIDLKNFSCQLKLVEKDEWVNSVHFEVG